MKAFKCFLASLLLPAWLSAQPAGSIPTTAFTRDLLRSADAAAARTKLEIGVGGTNGISFDPNQFTGIDPVHIIDGAFLTNSALYGASFPLLSTNKVLFSSGSNTVTTVGGPLGVQILQSTNASQALALLGITPSTNGANVVSNLAQVAAYPTDQGDYLFVMNGAAFNDGGGGVFNRVLEADYGGNDGVNEITSTDDATYAWKRVADLTQYPDLELANLGDVSISGSTNQTVAWVDNAGAANLKAFPAGVLDIRWFGAVADDSTSDTAAINAALSAAASVPGSTVYIPPGLFYFTNQITLQPQVTLKVDGHLKLDWANTSTNIGNAFQNLSYATTPSFDTNGAAVTVDQDITILGPGCIDFAAEDADQNLEGAAVFNTDGTRRFYSHGFALRNIDNLRMSGLVISNAQQFAVSILASKNVLVDHNIVRTGYGLGNTEYYDGKNQDGIHFNAVQNGRVLGNDIESSDDAFACGTIYSNSVTRNIQVIGNRLACHIVGPSRESNGTTNYWAAAAGVRSVVEDTAATDPNAYVDGILIEGNLMEGGSSGVLMGGTTLAGYPTHRNIVVRNNIMRNYDFVHDQTATAPDGEPAAIFKMFNYANDFAAVQNLVFAGNVITNSARHGLRVYHAKDVVVEGNIFADIKENINISATLPAVEPILLDTHQGNVTNAVIRGNVIKDVVGRGIYVGGGASKTVTGLVIDGNFIEHFASANADTAQADNFAAIACYIADDRVISRNVIQNGNGTGIALQGDLKDRVEVTDNLIRNLTDVLGSDGILVYDNSGDTFPSAVVSGNRVDNVAGRGIYILNCLVPDVVGNHVTSPGQGATGIGAIQFYWDVAVSGGGGQFSKNVLESTTGNYAAVGAETTTWSGVKINALDNVAFGAGSGMALGSATNSMTMYPRVSGTGLNLTNYFDAYGIYLLNLTNASSTAAMYLQNNHTNFGVSIVQAATLAANNHALRVFSSTAAQTAAPLTYLWDNNSSSSQNTLKVQNHGTGAALFVDQNNGDTGGAINIDMDANSASRARGLIIDVDNAGGGGVVGIYVAGLAADDPVLEVPTDATAGVDATIVARIAVRHNGAIKYLRLYND